MFLFAQLGMTIIAKKNIAYGNNIDVDHLQTTGIQSGPSRRQQRGPDQEEQEEEAPRLRPGLTFEGDSSKS